MQETVIAINALEKSFVVSKGVKIQAVSGVSLSVNKGEMFALVGPDGAGKTTIIRMLCGILKPDGGSASLFGLDIKTQMAVLKQRIGYLSQKFSLYGDLSIDENIEFFARIHNVRGFESRREDLLEFTRLKAFRDRLADKLSGGMKQKLALACTLIHTPDVIFLDEPTTGVDPVTRRDFWKLLAELLKDGVTIFLTTPYLDEAERCNRVALMNKGNLLALDTPERIRNAFGQRIAQVAVSNARNALTFARQRESLISFFDDVQIFGERLEFVFTKGTTDEAEKLIERELSNAGFQIFSARFKSPTLENVFINLLAKETSEARV
jgi:ABC-2 type transport system ATP-binding protein